MRQVKVWFDNGGGYNSWGYHAEIDVPGVNPGQSDEGTLSASGPDETYALANLKRVYDEYCFPPPDPSEYPKIVEVDW
jgi:hypothetical protein